jgi:hypothetical protein
MFDRLEWRSCPWMPASNPSRSEPFSESGPPRRDSSPLTCDQLPRTRPPVWRLLIPFRLGELGELSALRFGCARPPAHRRSGRRGSSSRPWSNLRCGGRHSADRVSSTSGWRCACRAVARSASGRRARRRIGDQLPNFQRALGRHALAAHPRRARRRLPVPAVNDALSS